jgi:GMP synthase-like glutamine amidotransferase
MAQWFEAQAAKVDHTRFFGDPALSDLEGLDLIVAMGGPMSVNDEAAFPWLRGEKEFLRKAVARGVPVLGVCLGAQLIASALGAKVYRNSGKEIGWFPIAAEGGADSFHFPDKCVVFHWHGETFDLPPGAVRLAQSRACANQAFQVGRRVIALQFHLEMTPENTRAIINNCRDELVSGPYIQTESELLGAPDSVYRSANSLMEDVLSYITAPV